MQQQTLLDYTLHLADNSLIMGHRLSEWTGHGPMLEQDIALSNIALDLIGQARHFYQYAAKISNSKSCDRQNASLKFETEDTFAYMRNAGEFKNCILTELPNGDWGVTILKLYFFSAFQFLLYEQLKYSSDKELAGIAEKSLKETAYHVRWSAEWVIRLGDGTDESKQRLLHGLDLIKICLNELFYTTFYEAECFEMQMGADLKNLKDNWVQKVKEVFEEATLPFDIDIDQPLKIIGKTGNHTEHLHQILEDMQMLQRTYPGCEW